MHRMAYGYRVFVCSNMAFAGEFTPVLAKHSKSFSLVDCIAVGVDRITETSRPDRARPLLRAEYQESQLRTIWSLSNAFTSANAFVSTTCCAACSLS
jgi:hypothetical protein